MSTPDAVYRRYLSAVLLHGHAGAKACGLGATDLYALNVLDLAGSMTPGELATRTGLTTGPTTRLIDRLEEAGYVRRTAAPGDRRKVIVEQIAKPAGLDAVLAPARRKIAEIIQEYSAEQVEVLFDYFSRATEAYQEATDELRRSAPEAR